MRVSEVACGARYGCILSLSCLSSQCQRTDWRTSSSSTYQTMKLSRRSGHLGRVDFSLTNPSRWYRSTSPRQPLELDHRYRRKEYPDEKNTVYSRHPRSHSHSDVHDAPTVDPSGEGQARRWKLPKPSFCKPAATASYSGTER